MTLQQLRESGFQDADIEAAYWLAKLGRGDSSPVVFHINMKPGCAHAAHELAHAYIELLTERHARLLAAIEAKAKTALTDAKLPSIPRLAYKQGDRDGEVYFARHLLAVAEGEKE